MTRRLRIGAVALAAWLLAACGVPAQDEPHAVGLPRRPLTGTAPVPAGTAAAGDLAEVLCFVRDGSLVEAVRRVGTRSSPQQQVADLAAGPTEVERDAGLTTALTATALSVGLPAGSTEARVEVAVADEGGARSDEMIAYGQIVCTLTARPDVGSVVFVRDGARLEVPRADGSLSAGPLYGSDYASLVRPR
jgi:hypothetical protein